MWEILRQLNRSVIIAYWRKHVMDILKELSSMHIETTRDSRTATFLFQRLSVVVIQKGNARCILDSRLASEELAELHNLNYGFFI